MWPVDSLIHVERYLKPCRVAVEQTNSMGSLESLITERLLSAKIHWLLCRYLTDAADQKSI